MWPMLTAGCNRGSSHAPENEDAHSPFGDRLAELRRQIYRNTDTVFEKALFYKPLDGSAPDEIIKLAPLIVQEVDGSQPVDASFKLAGPTVYYESKTVRVGDQDQNAMVFSWRHGNDVQFRDRAIRMTLGDDGFPVIFETNVNSDSQLRILFVSKSFEEAAAAGNAAVLPERQFLIETSVDNAPHVVVARVIEDGPMPMGPFVYLSRDNSSFTTLICRCMPSQARQFVETAYYELRPASDSNEPPSSKFPFDLDAPAKILRIPQSPKRD
ncbi:MAG: hypothetical protein IPK83_13620 [Planctomycetes bacterium]|nr:hypothetical protein [Planctomycetota bacterium]